MEKKVEDGYVYILTNQSFREDWVKIGKSARPVDIRSKELDNTAVPLPLDIFATIRTVKYNEVEKLVHNIIDNSTQHGKDNICKIFELASKFGYEIKEIK